MNIKIDKIANGIDVESMVEKPVKGVTEEGTTIFENELQLKLKNMALQRN